MKPGDRAIIWRSRYCEEPKWVGRTIVLASKPYNTGAWFSISSDGSEGRIHNGSRFVKFYFEDELDDPERERHAVTVKAIQKIRAKQVVEVGSWAEIGWKPEGIK